MVAAISVLVTSAMVDLGSLDLGALTNLVKTADTTTISRLSRTSHFYKTACHSVLTDRRIARAAELAAQRQAAASAEEAARAAQLAERQAEELAELEVQRQAIEFVNRIRESRGLPPLRPSEIDSDSESEGGISSITTSNHGHSD